MFNLGTRAFFVTSAVTFVFGLAYAFNSSDVGGFTLLLSASFAAAFLGAVSLAATGTADRFTIAGVQDLRSGRAPSSSAVPMLVAAGLGVTALGTALGVAAYVGGLIVVASVARAGSWPVGGNIPITSPRSGRGWPTASAFRSACPLPSPR